MFTMTYNEALLIQRAQMAYYRQVIGRSGCKAIRKATVCPNDINPNEKMPVRIINELVPRGGDFEQYIKRIKASDLMNLYYHNAIRRGLI